MTREFSFNLVDEPWIPCIDVKGRAVELNLRDLFAQAHHLRAITGDTPPVTAALYRFLLAILHRVFGPKDEDAWAELWRAEQWDTRALNDYLVEWRHRFDLFDEERPFYQSADLYMESSWVSVRRLAHHLGSINTLFEHLDDEKETVFSASIAVRFLIAAQGFGLCGTSGAFFPQNRTGDKKVQAMFVDGINARAINFIVEGDSLFETLMLNMIRYPNEEVIMSFEDDVPMWERDSPTSPKRGALTGYLDYLTWQNRRILLKPELDASGKTVVAVMRWEPSDRLEAILRDPMQHNMKNKKEGFSFLRYNEDKVLWRDSAALLSVHQTNADDRLYFPPATLQWLKYLKDPFSGVEVGLEKNRIFRCLALGMSSKPGQANVYFYREERIPLPVAYFQDPKLVTGLYDALSVGEKLARDVYIAVQIMGMHSQIPDADSKKWGGLSQGAKSSISNWIQHTGMERSYWASLDIPFQSFIVDLARDQEKALATWHEALRQSAWAAFEQAAECTGNDGRSFKAVVRGRGYLNYRLKEVLPTLEEVK